MDSMESVIIDQSLKTTKTAEKKAKPIKNKSRQKRNLRVPKKYLTISRGGEKKNLYQYR